MEKLTICNILLRADMDIPMPIIIMISLFGLIGIPLLIRFVEKVTGTTTVVRSRMTSHNAALQKAQKDAAEYERKIIKKLKNMDPRIVEQAKNNIHNSIYANTIQNIYEEALKINRLKKIKDIYKKYSTNWNRNE